MSKQKTAVIIGAGPAGLTAAYELLLRTDVRPIVIEKDPTYVGGISRTVNYKGNRIDIGGHRFFSKSDRVMRWWAEMLPIKMSKNTEIKYQRGVRALTQDLRQTEEGESVQVMHVRPRKTHILYGGQLYEYPIALSFDTLRKLGLSKVIRIGFAYFYTVLFPVRPERTLEDFFLNRFGRELYETFFKSYTEKVWGMPCTEISAEWGKQRIKGLSITRAVAHALRNVARVGTGKGVETSLIEQFLYPTYGPGQMWEQVADKVRSMGGEIRMGWEVVGLKKDGEEISAVDIRNPAGEKESLVCDYVFSTTDIQHLIQMLQPDLSIREVAEGLKYRDFVTVGLLLASKPKSQDGLPLKDTWMYIHDESVQVGRIQFFHNWHPSLVANQEHGWVGLEYFCQQDDDLWEMDDAALLSLAKAELDRIGIGKDIPVLDGVVIRQPKAYPAYFGSYDRFGEISKYLDTISNLYPIGRNGMHRYNNQDHSMLAAMEAVDLIETGRKDKSALWDINAEQEYHEEKS